MSENFIMFHFSRDRGSITHLCRSFLRLHLLEWDNELVVSCTGIKISNEPITSTICPQDHRNYSL